MQEVPCCRDVAARAHVVFMKVANRCKDKVPAPLWEDTVAKHMRITAEFANSGAPYCSQQWRDYCYQFFHLKKIFTDASTPH